MSPVPPPPDHGLVRPGDWSGCELARFAILTILLSSLNKVAECPDSARPRKGGGATTNLSPSAKRTTRQRAAGAAAEAASEVPLSHYHTASQPTLAAHGELWAQNCRSASALQKARNQAKTGQAEKKSEKKPARKPAPARPQPTRGAESKNRIPRKRKA